MKSEYLLLLDDGQGLPSGSMQKSHDLKRAPSSVSLETRTLSEREYVDTLHDPRTLAISFNLPLKEPEQESALDVQDHPPLEEWGLEVIGAHGAESTNDGTGVAVAILDTGFSPSEGVEQLFENQEVTCENFTSGPIQDELKHGTQVSAIVFGSFLRSTRIGVAPGVEKAYSAKVSGNRAKADSFYKGLLEAAKWGAHIACASLEVDLLAVFKEKIEDGQSKEAALSFVVEANHSMNRMIDEAMTIVGRPSEEGPGMCVIAAAGNGSNRDHYKMFTSLPASHPKVLAVGGAVRSGEMLTVHRQSNRPVDLCAPAARFALANGWLPIGKTSASAAYATGVAALYAQRQIDSGGGFDPHVLIEEMRTSATKSMFTTDTEHEDIGHGLVKCPGAD